MRVGIMKILYSLPFWPYLYTPWLFSSMKWMLDRGHQLAVVSLGDPPGASADLRDFGLQDVPVLQVRMQCGSDGQLLGNLITMPWRAWRAPASQTLKQFRQSAGTRQGFHEWLTIKRVSAFVRKHQIEVIDAHWASHSAAMARQITLATGVPYAMKLWGGDIYRNPAPNLQQLVESAGAVMPASRFLADLLLGKRPVPSLPMVPPVQFDLNKLRISLHGLPSSAFATEPVAQSSEIQVVGTIGRLDPEKRHNHLVEAIARLAPSYPGLRLRIVGGGQLEGPLRAQATELGIADRVTITGSLPWAQVIEERKNFHIYAHAAEAEGFSLATLEGISCGLPAVATKTGAHAQMIVDGVTGHLVDIEDVPALCARLKQLLDAGPQGRLTMAAAALRHVRTHFQYDDVMAFNESVLDAVRRKAALPQQV